MDRYLVEDDRLFCALARGEYDDFDITPKSFALNSARLDIVKHCYVDSKSMSKILLYFAEFGRFDEMFYYLNKGYPITSALFSACIKSGKITEDMAKKFIKVLDMRTPSCRTHGQNLLLQFIRQEELEPYYMAAYVGNQMCLDLFKIKFKDPFLIAAIFGNQVEIFDNLLEDHEFSGDESCVLAAAMYSKNEYFIKKCANINIVDIHLSACGINIKNRYWAAFYGDVQAFRFRVKDTEQIASYYAAAVYNNRLKMLKILKTCRRIPNVGHTGHRDNFTIEQMCENAGTKQDVVRVALKCGNKKILRWLYKFLGEAAFRFNFDWGKANFEAIEFMYKTGYVSDLAVAHKAIEFRKLDKIRKYCKSGMHMVGDAFLANSLKTLKLVTKICGHEEFNRQPIYTGCEKSIYRIQSTKMLEWIQEIRNISLENFFKGFSYAPNLRGLIWLENSGYKLDYHKILEHAENFKKIEVYEWALDRMTANDNITCHEKFGLMMISAVKERGLTIITI